jgi:predicted TIM-barrel fold metal-dependent hydrolase
MILESVQSGEPLDGLEVIDCHGHLGGWSLTFVAKPGLDDTIRTMDRLGIDRLCLSAFAGLMCDFRKGNDLVAEAVGRYPDRLIGQMTINPNVPDEVLPELERCRRHHGMRLGKLHPYFDDYPVDGPGYREFWRHADAQGMVVLVHTSEGDKNCAPGMFDAIARDYPNARIILGHSGVTLKGCEEAIGVARRHDNLYLDTGCSQPHFGMIERFVAEVGADRVLFGSDMPLLEPAAQLGRIAYAKIRDSEKAMIFGGNLKRLLGE